MQAKCEALETPSNSSVPVLITQLATMAAIPQTIWYLVSFPSSGVPGAPYFNEVDVMCFLDWFKLLGENHGVKDAGLVKKLPEYCKLGIQKEIKLQDEYIYKD